jgi:hypothetical protein
MTDLFAEMNRCAEALRRNHPLNVRRSDLLLLWCELQRARGETLSPDQSADLFEVWLAQDLGRWQARIDARAEALWRFIERCMHSDPPFRCVCGQELGEIDLEAMLVHGPHIADVGELKPGMSGAL